MSTPRQSLSSVTLGDIGKAMLRYRPFLAAVAAVLLVVVLVPGHPGSGSTSTLTPAAVPGAAVGATGGTAAAPGTTGTGTVGAAGATTGGLPTGATGGTAAGATTTTGGAGGTSSGGGTSSTTTSGGGTTSTLTTSGATDAFCDKATGRLRLPTLYAPPCMPPYNGNNGGHTWTGVTKDTITIAVPRANNQAEAQAIAKAAGDNDTHAQTLATEQGYLNVFEHHVQTYGRKFKIAEYTSSYNSGDSTAAQNTECQSDATMVAKKIQAFISWGECGTNAYENTLAHDGVLCFCTVTVPASFYLNWAPYVWGTGLPDETQAYLMRTEMICKELAPYAPNHAGEADLNAPAKKTRKFALVWPGASAIDNTDVYKPGAAFFAAQLKKCGVNLAFSDSFPIIDPTGPADAQTLMAKYKSNGVTSVIFAGDPLDPIFLTGAATKQAYFPEWIVTGSALTDETHFGRLYDQNQWSHAFGISLLQDRVPVQKSDAYNLWNWQFHSSPPANYGYPVIYVLPFFLATGVSLAGPHLTPQTFQCGEPPYTSQTHSGWLGSGKPIGCIGKTYPGIFGYPISPTNYAKRVANAVISWGSKLWPWDDYNMLDDGTLIYWDAKASGPDESGNNGTGMYRYLHLGQRYSYGQFPKGQQPWFNPSGTVTVFSNLPAADRPPSYPQKCYYLCNSPGY